jgi:hypothetical protein
MWGSSLPARPPKSAGAYPRGVLTRRAVLHPPRQISGPPVGERIGARRWDVFGCPQPRRRQPTDRLGELASELFDGAVGHLDVDGRALAGG